MVERNTMTHLNQISASLNVKNGKLSNILNSKAANLKLEFNKIPCKTSNIYNRNSINRISTSVPCRNSRSNTISKTKNSYRSHSSSISPSFTPSVKISCPVKTNGSKSVNGKCPEVTTCHCNTDDSTLPESTLACNNGFSDHCTEKVVSSMQIQGVQNNVIFTRKHVKLKSFVKLKSPSSSNDSTYRNDSQSWNNATNESENNVISSCVLDKSDDVTKVPSKVSIYFHHQNNCDFDVVYESMQRLSYIYEQLNSVNIDHLNDKIEPKKITNILSKQNINANIEIFKFKKIPNKCMPKSMRSLIIEDSCINKNHVKSTSSDDGMPNIINDQYYKCNWQDCKHQYRGVDKLSRHVKKEHLLPASKNDVFLCFWKNCKFGNQASCSFKWLSRHVLGHCDIKPFKCVIHGCDMGFSTQNGLARHVPTHFNERNVRRTCVISNKYSQADNNHFINNPLHFESDNQSNIGTPNGESSTGSLEEVSYTPSGEKQMNFVTTTSRCPQKVFKQIQKKLQCTSTNPVTNHGYCLKKYRFEHKVLGKRTTPNTSSNDVLLTPLPDKLFSKCCKSNIWLDEESIRKRTHVDVPLNQLSFATKIKLYDAEHASFRRKKKRK